MKYFTLFFTALLFSGSAWAQDFEIPQDVEMKELEDYARHQENMVPCFDWLMQTPANEQVEKRKAAQAYLLKWLTGTDYFTLQLNADMIPYTEDNPELLIIFMGGWAKQALQKPKLKDDQVAGNVAGIEAVIAFYEKNKNHLGKDRSIKKFAKLKEKGKLRDWVEKKLS